MSNIIGNPQTFSAAPKQLKVLRANYYGTKIIAEDPETKARIGVLKRRKGYAVKYKGHNYEYNYPTLDLIE